MENEACVLCVGSEESWAVNITITAQVARRDRRRWDAGPSAAASSGSIVLQHLYLTFHDDYRCIGIGMMATRCRIVVYVTNSGVGYSGLKYRECSGTEQHTSFEIFFDTRECLINLSAHELHGL